MDFSLTRQQEMLRETVRQFSDSELAPRALELDERGGVSLRYHQENWRDGLDGAHDAEGIRWEGHGTSGEDDSHGGNISLPYARERR